MPIRLSVLSGLGLSHAIICVKAERVVRDEGTPGWAFIGRSGFGVPLARGSLTMGMEPRRTCR